MDVCSPFSFRESTRFAESPVIITPSDVSLGMEKYPPQGKCPGAVMRGFSVFDDTGNQRMLFVFLKFLVRIELRIFGTEMGDKPDDNPRFGNAIYKPAAGKSFPERISECMDTFALFERITLQFIDLFYAEFVDGRRLAFIKMQFFDEAFAQSTVASLSQHNDL